MHRDDEQDSFGRSSFSFGGGHRASRGSANAPPQDHKTAAQLLKLQKLVESLVVRELERGGGSSSANANASSNVTPRLDAPSRHHHPHQRSQQHYYHSNGSAAADMGAGGIGAGAGSSRKQPSHRGSSISSDTSSMDNNFANSTGGLVDALGRVYGSGAVRPRHVAAGMTRGPAAGFRSPGRLFGGGGLEDGVHVQVAALQGQLAVLGEQLSSAYRAAEGVMSPPRATAAAVAAAALRGPGGQQAHAAAVAGGMTGDYGNSLGPQPSYLATTPRPTSPHVASAPLAAAPPPPLQQRQQQHFLTSGMLMTAGPTETAGSSELVGGDGYGVAGGNGGGGQMPAGSGGGGGGSSHQRMRQLAAEERAGREAAAREDERLRSWIQDLRTERRRLEDRLLDGDSSGAAAQQLRDDLEKQVLSLSRQRDQLAAELGELGVTRTGNTQLAGQVEALEAALAAEVERVARYKEVRPALEARLADAAASLEGLQQQHGAALEAMAQERDAAMLKAKRAAKRAAELDAALDAANAEIRRLQEEVRSHAVSLAEVRASGEVMQAANQQMQVNMETQARETATRLAAMQGQLEASQSEGAIVRRQLEAAQQAAATLREQLKEAQSRVDSLAQEREQLSGSVSEEQRGAAAARQQLETLGKQLKASEEARAEAGRAAAAQLEAMRRQHALDLAATQKQYETQLGGAEKQYLLLQRQYDAGLASNDKAAEAAAMLRRERDALWADAENLRAELDEVRKEKAEVSAKLTALRTEVRATMEEVARDRDARLAATTTQSELQVREARAEAERRVAVVQQEYSSKLAGLRETSEKLRSEAAEAQRHVDKYRTAVSRLKDQVRDLLLSRDAAERELASERAFNEELNRIVSAIRAEQQQQQHMGTGSGSGPGSGPGLDARIAAIKGK